MHALYDLVKDLHPQPQILTPAQRRACPRLWYCCARFRVCVGGGKEEKGSVCVSLSLLACVHAYTYLCGTSCASLSASARGRTCYVRDTIVIF